MTTLFITEFSARTDGAFQMFGVAPPISEQTVVIGGASAASAAFNPETKLIRVHADVACSISFGTDPTATTGSARLAANSTEYFAVNSGLKIAVISNN